MTRALPLTLAAMLTLAGAGCVDAGPRYGETRYSEAAAAPPTAYRGRVAQIETIQVDSGYRFGVGSVIGAVAGGLLGHTVGRGSGNTAATIAGAAAGGVAGTAAESKLNKQEATRITVDLRSGGSVVVVQPPDPRIRRGMTVDVVGSGDNARVVPG